jgi:hypothetical protein
LEFIMACESEYQAYINASNAVSAAQAQVNWLRNPQLDIAEQMGVGAPGALAAQRAAAEEALTAARADFDAAREAVMLCAQGMAGG